MGKGLYALLMDSGGPITIVHTKDGLCLTTKQFSSWRDVQEDFEGYMASLGPFDVDELLGYLDAEYSDRSPFGRSDVLGLVGRSDGYMWSAIESPPVGEGLKLGTTDLDSIRLEIVGLQFPDAADRDKRYSWYVVDGSATNDGIAWDFRWPALTCDVPAQICGWLLETAGWVETVPRGEPPRPPWLIEPNLQFPNVSWANGRAVLTVELDLEFLPPEVQQVRHGAGNPQVLRLSAAADDLRRAAIDFAATIARFPASPGPSRPVSN